MKNKTRNKKTNSKRKKRSQLMLHKGSKKFRRKERKYYAKANKVRYMNLFNILFIIFSIVTFIFLFIGIFTISAGFNDYIIPLGPNSYSLHQFLDSHFLDSHWSFNNAMNYANDNGASQVYGLVISGIFFIIAWLIPLVLTIVFCILGTRRFIRDKRKIKSKKH